MSKINQLQAEALKTPVTITKPATTQVKTQVNKPPATKTPVKTTPSKTANTKTNPTLASEKNAKAKSIKEKTPKLKMERDSFTMPKTEYAQFSVLKDRLAKLGQPAKKSELLRAGIMQLSAMTDAALKAAMNKVPTIKTGRPKK